MTIDMTAARVGADGTDAHAPGTIVGGFTAGRPPVINARPGAAPNIPVSGSGKDSPAGARPPGTRAKSGGVVPRDVYIGAIGVVAVTWAMWVMHGGLSMLFAGGVQSMLALGQLTGLAAGLAALAGVALAARPAVLERNVGLLRMLGWHRWLGIIVGFGTLAHLVTILIAYAARAQVSIVGEAVTLLGRPWMLSAYIAGAMIFLVTLTSWRRIRTSMSYETWYFLHLLGYAAVALALGHALVLGSDFASDTVARWWWISLYVATAVVVVVSRAGALVGAAMRPATIVRVDTEADNALSLWVRGRLPQRTVAGQFFGLRVLTKDLWWQSHPLSISSAPRPVTEGRAGEALVRFSIKLDGDSTREFRAITPGTRVVLEGPYGVFTLAQDARDERATTAAGRKVLLLGAGSGIAPIHALAEQATPAQEPVALLRARRQEDVWFAGETEQVVRERGGRVLTSVGRRSALASGDPLAPASLLAACPDIAEREVYICGPVSFIRAAHRAATKLGVPAESIHDERFGY